MFKEILRMERITTYLGGTRILDNAKLNLFEKEVIGIVGVNYSGKTTLAGGISGVFPYTSGQTFLNEKQVKITSMEEAREKGVFYIQPRFSLINDFTIAENIFLLKEKGGNFLIKRKELEERTTEYLKLMNLLLTQDRLIQELSYKNKIIVEICKALVNDAKIIIFDSIFGGLSEEAEELFCYILELLKSLHVSVMLIESRLKPLKPFCNRLFVIRSGRTVGILGKNEIEDNKVISLMIGNKVDDDEEIVSISEKSSNKVLLEVEKVYYKNVLKNLSFSIYKNEILGILNVNKNSGRAIEKILTGLDFFESGSIRMNGKELYFQSTEESLKHGITIVTEEDNIFEDLSLAENITISALKKNSNILGIMNTSELKFIKNELISEFLRKGSNDHWDDESLRKGWLTQKKIAFCRALAPGPKLMILMHPTQRIDIVSKQEIYEDIVYLKKQNISVLIISSDVNELVSICERIVVVKNGKALDDLQVNEGRKDKILKKYGKYLREI